MDVVTYYCCAVTDQGKPCSRKHSKCIGNKYYCTQHYNMLLGKRIVYSATDVEPWTKLGLLCPYESNGKRIMQRIRTMLKRGPKKGDCAGTLYVYWLASEETLNYWKIGRTERDLDERLKEWRSQQGQHDLTLKAAYKVAANHKMVESLIHLYLAYCRMYRYPHDGGFHSVWALDPSEVIQDGQQLAAGERAVAKNKHKEWFCESFETIHAIIDSICRVVPSML